MFLLPGMLPAVPLGTSKFPEEQVTAWGLGSDCDILFHMFYHLFD